jgi:hypothetical protein
MMMTKTGDDDAHGCKEAWRSRGTYLDVPRLLCQLPKAGAAPLNPSTLEDHAG